MEVQNSTNGSVPNYYLSAPMSIIEDLLKTLDLIRLERQADLEQYRQKVLLRSLSQRTKEGVTWYPVRLKRDYIGTGERIIVELERTNHLDQPHSFQSGKLVSLFCNASGKPEKEHANGVVNYVSDNILVITLNGDDLPSWIDDGMLGVDVMFDEMSYKEMEFAMKAVIKSEDNRLAQLKEILLGGSGGDVTSNHQPVPIAIGTSNQQPVTSNQQPVTSNQQPVTSNQLPVTNNQQPVTSNQQPVTSNQQPVTSNQQPVTSNHQPAASALLNESQNTALQKILASTDVGFIHGPPGTGKTTTLAQAILATTKTEKQVLVCTPSNAAIDLVVEKLSELGLNVVRIGHPARVTEQTLSKTLDARIAAHPNYSELRALRKQLENLRAKASKYKRTFGHHEREERRMLKEEAKTMKADADVLEFYIVNDLLNKAEVICSTLVGSSHPVLKGRKFKTVFIDEAAQALEPACWIPILKSERVILAGDHCQLPPTIKSNEAAKEGLSVTLFEKGIRRRPEKASMLTVQYRMHGKIMKFSSRYFYKDQLIAHPSVKNWLLNPYESPVEFIDTAGCGYTEAQDPETLSRFNLEEAHLLIRQTEKLVESIGLEAWIEQNITMGIITPYRAQVDYLHKLAEASPVLEPLHKLVTINTVDAFQGQERDAIAISFVRSNDKSEVGFLGDIRRTNVAMTRARKKLIMIGDSATLGAHPFYVELLDFVQQEGFYKSAFEIS
jgi:ATP-dependent RNA/DNA helicase IGHMBP2